MLNVTEVKARIESMHDYADKLRVFRLKLEGDSFSFAPGQFVMLSIPGLVDRNGRKIAKAYSIASSSDERGILELCIVYYPNGALSVPLFNLGIGAEVLVTGPYGFFSLKTPVPPGTVFLAGGTGLAPIISMLRYLYRAGYTEPLWLFYSISFPELFLFKDELLGYRKSNGLQFVASTSNPDGSWQWEKGRVTATFPKYLPQLQQDGVPNESRQFYICGPPLMVTDTVKMLEQLGFKKENIHKEQW